MSLKHVGLLAVDSSRTRAYLAALRQHDLMPAHTIYLAGDGGAGGRHFPPVSYFDNMTPALDTLRAAGVPCEIVPANDVNGLDVIAAVQSSPAEVLIYSGPGGAILRRDILNTGKCFLHIHLGVVPQFRGSTTIYYSLLIAGNCGASAIFLDERIDNGPVLAKRAYPPPADRTTIDYGYDPYIRADLLVRVLRDYQAIGEFRVQPQCSEEGETYYIMHPVLRHIAVLSRRGSV